MLGNEGFIVKKPEEGVGEMWNFVCNHIFSCSKRNLKITFLSQALFIVQIFSKYFHLPDHHKIFGASFYRSHSTRPTIFFTSFLQPAGIATDSFENCSSAYGRVQLVPKYISKVKLNRGSSPNILSEIMRFQENGSRGKHFAQFP